MALSASRGHDSRGEWGDGPATGGSVDPATLVLDGTSAASVRVPDRSFLTDGQFVRSGADLKIDLPDGRTALVEGYFHGAQSPDLVGPDGGAILSPGLVQSFLGSLTPGQYAQAAPSVAAQPIGHVDTLVGQATAVRTDGTRVTLENGDPVFQGDVIETGGDASAVRLLFADKTMFALGPEARLALDEMVFDSASQEGSVQFSILKGIFIFASGQIAKTDNTDMTVTTPVATIGIRGTEVAGRVAEGDSQFTIIDGAIEVTTRAGSVALDSRGETTDVTGMDSPPGTPYLLTPTEYAEAYKAVAGVAGEYFGGGDTPDGGDGLPGEQRGDLDQDHDGETSTDLAAGGDTDAPATLARTIGGDTTTLFGAAGSSGEAWSDATAATRQTVDGASLDGSTVGIIDSANVYGGADSSGEFDGSDSVPVTQDSGVTTQATSSDPTGDPIFELASGLTLDGGPSTGDSLDLSTSDALGPGVSSSPLRLAQDGQHPAWGNAYWGADGGPYNADPDFGWQLPETAFAKIATAGDAEFGPAFKNEYEELAALAGDRPAADQADQGDQGDQADQADQGDLAEGITLVVSHKSINGTIQDLTDSFLLPDLGPGSSVTITGEDLGLTGIAGTARISLTRDAVDSVDVALESAWNSVQNIRVESDMSGDVAVSNFVHTDIRLGDGGDSTVTVTDAKRGFISTGDGDDQISIQAASDGFSGSTVFDVATGAGDDTLVFSAAADGSSMLAFDGGEGTDTLWLAGPLADFDLTGASYDLSGVERLVVSGDADVTATLSAELVATMAGEFNDLTDSANTVLVDGDAGDSLDLGDGWSVSGSTDIDGTGYTIYEHADGVRVVADNDITVV